MKLKKEVTVYDIATKMDPSSATVSRRLNDHPAANKNTWRKIGAATKKPGCHHHSLASNLRKQKTDKIGVNVHELNSNFITSVLVDQGTKETGNDLIIAHSSESFEKEFANALNLYHKTVDRLIASSAFDTQEFDHFNAYYDRSLPIVFFDYIEENSESTKLIIDNYKKYRA